MTHVRTRALTGATLAVSFAAALTLTGGALASPARESASTPVPILTPDGQVSAYVVNARHETPGQTRKVERAVERAGGVVVQSWPQIGVVIAHSDRAAFRVDVVRKGGYAVDTVGATRTVAVSEGTPDARRGGTVKDEFANTPQADVVPDPREGEQWDMQMIKADQAHQVSDGSRDVVVGVLDSGIDADHPDLAPNIDVADSVNCTDAGRPDTSATGWQPTTSDHGTHVAGTIAAARNGVGIVGVAPGVRMASVKVVNDAGFIYPEYAVCGFVWAGMHRMDVTNNSYYVDPFMYYCSDQPDQAAAKEAVDRAVQWSTRQGTVHAAAAGNAATDLSNNTTDTTSPDDSTPINRTINNGCEDIPAELDGVVTVSSFAQVGTTLDSQLSSFSNRGLGKIDVAAPGSRILSTVVEGNGYGLKSGTSMASPHVAGVLALMRSAHPRWSPRTMLAMLRAQADDKACSAPQGNVGPACVGNLGDNSYAGQGMVDALDAIQ
ncbi:S8 family peptidase [Nocardioides sp. LHG3406-4]|uniref:S8 family peptidase n=1 Tax=Nocardioides sp. LHG3406-4 TaxID=2804575 RepID=UPI003CE6859A